MDNQPLFIVIIILVLFFIYNTSTKPVKQPQPQPPKVPLARPYYQHVHTFNPMKQFYNHKYWG